MPSPLLENGEQKDSPLKKRRNLRLMLVSGIEEVAGGEYGEEHQG